MKIGLLLRITLISVLLSTVISMMVVMNARTIEGYGSTRIYISFMVESFHRSFHQADPLRNFPKIKYLVIYLEEK